MAEVNGGFLNLRGNYLFAETARRTEKYKKENPNKAVIKLGIGDVTRPLPKTIVAALHNGTDEMGRLESFRGYGPEQGYGFLRDAILEHDYRARGIDLSSDEIFVSDGAKSDLGNIGDIFSENNIAAIGDPVYPVYLDTNVIAGRSGSYVEGKGYEKIVLMPCLEENGFLPEIPNQKVDLIYLCLPNNPTGAAATKDYLEKWVDYANANDSVILYDSAYEAFIQEKDIPKSIFEIRGAKTCAIEFRSFSKTAGFTGTRCAYTVVPKELQLNGISLKDLWLRRQTTKFNGVPYIIQKAAAACYSPEGRKELTESIDYYMNNAKTIREGLSQAGFQVFGGINAPYIWFKIPEKYTSSWDYFDLLLNEAQVVTTPGVGFGASGEGFLRVTAFGKYEDTLTAINRMNKLN